MLRGCRIFSRLGHASVSAELIRRAQGLVGPDASVVDRLMLAELLFKAKRWDEAAAIYQTLAVPGRLSDLNDRLLECHIKGHHRARAKELIATLPASWIEASRLRHLAIDLGQDAGDWQFLKPLAHAQVRQNPGQRCSLAARSFRSASCSLAVRVSG